MSHALCAYPSEMPSVALGLINYSERVLCDCYIPNEPSPETELNKICLRFLILFIIQESQLTTLTFPSIKAHVTRLAFPPRRQIPFQYLLARIKRSYKDYATPMARSVEYIMASFDNRFPRCVLIAKKSMSMTTG